MLSAGPAPCSFSANLNKNFKVNGACCSSASRRIYNPLNHANSYLIIGGAVNDVSSAPYIQT